MNQIMHILAEEFVNAFIPQSAQAGLIAECAAAFEVHSIDGLGGRVEQQLKFILTFALRLFCPPAFGDFHYHAYHPQHLALFVEVCTTGSIHPNHTTVGTHYSIAELKVRLVRAKGSNRSQKSLSVVWVNLSQSLLASSVCRLIDPQNLRRFCRAQDHIGGSIPLISKHLAGLSCQTKTVFALAQCLFRMLALGHIDTDSDVTDKRAILTKSRHSNV